MVILSWWTASAAACETWGPVTELRSLVHPDLEESSGLAVSRVTPGSLWTHDDSGDAVLFRFSLDGDAQKFEFPNADNDDWEGMATATCPGRGDCLYVGDIGAERKDAELTVYVGREPTSGDTITLVERWVLTWPGAPRDAETLLVDPCTLDAWIVTRGATTEVFRIPDNRGPRSRELEPVATLAVEEPITGGDFSPDGAALILRSDTSVYQYDFDPTAPDAHWGDTPTVVTDQLQPGEAIAWEPDGDLILTDEGTPTPVQRIACEDDIALDVCVAPGRVCGCNSAPTGLGWLLLFAPLIRLGRRSAHR